MRSLKRVTLDSFRGGLRGFGFADAYAGRMAQEGYDRFAATGANCARTAIVPELTKRGYVLPPEQLAELRYVVNELQARRAYTIPLMALRTEDEHAMVWDDHVTRESLIDIWCQVARIFRGRTAIAGFDLFNEPKMFRADQSRAYWDGFVEPCVRRIREIDPQRICITSTWPHGLCLTNPEWGEWIRHVPGTVLTAHLYAPFEYTHADMTEWSTPGKPWDPVLHTVLQEQARALLWLRDHALKSGQPVWIGEASTLQDRPGADEWALHFTQLMSAYNFSASWHYFIGWPGWHPNDNTLAHLQAWFKGGIKP